MQELPYSYRFYDSIFSMVNVRYRVQQSEGIDGIVKKHHHHDDLDSKLKDLKKSLSQKVNKLANKFRT